MSLKYAGVPVRIPYGAGKRTRLEIRAARMRAGIFEPFRLEPGAPLPITREHRDPVGKFTEQQQVRIAIGLLRLQEQRVLQVWIDGGKIRVAPFPTTLRAPSEPYATGVRNVTWTRAAEILKRGHL